MQHGSVTEALADCSEDASEFLNLVAMGESQADPDDVFVLLVRNAGTRALQSFQQTARISEDPLAYATVLSWLKLRVEELSGDNPKMESAERLVDWLHEHSEDVS